MAKILSPFFIFAKFFFVVTWGVAHQKINKKLHTCKGSGGMIILLLISAERHKKVKNDQLPGRFLC